MAANDVFRAKTTCLETANVLFVVARDNRAPGNPLARFERGTVRRGKRGTKKNVPSFRLPTVGSRAFPIAGAKVDLEQLTRRCHFRSVPVNLSAPFEDILIPLLLQHCLILLVLALSIVHGPRGGVAA